MEHESGVRVYGVTIGNSSAARVTAGIVEGLIVCKAFAGLVPVDDFDEEDQYDGAMARWAILVGPPPNINIMLRGYHERRYVLLAPNSSWVPRSIVEAVGDRFRMVSPSEWGAKVLRKHFDVPVSVYRHGVSGDFRPMSDLHDKLDADYRTGRWRVLHLTSSQGQRKGTAELLQAWHDFAVRSDVDYQLTIVAEPGLHYERWKAEAATVCPEQNIVVRMRVDLDVKGMAELYQAHHVVCQPSRGEGFGMVPLESRACGVPVVMTTCAGHSEHTRLTGNGNSYGVVEVQVGESAPIDDGPGAMAPSLSSNKIAWALDDAFNNWTWLHRESLDLSWFVHQDWSWPAVTRQWLRKEGYDVEAVE